MAEPIHLGFPGTVNAQQQAKWLPNVGGARFGVVGPDDLQVVRNTSIDRGISVNGGAGWGDAVYSMFDETIPAAAYGLPVPEGSAGTTRWHMIVARRDWQNPYTVTFPYLDAGPALPAALPAREDNPGVTADQPLALVEVIAGQTTVGQIIDLRCWAGPGGVFAKHLLARDYLEVLGAEVKINGVRWSYELGDNDVPDWVEQRLPVIAAGKVTIPIGSTAASATKAVTFPKAFSATPIVTVSMNSNVAGNASQLQPSGYGESPTGFTAKIQTNDAAAVGTAYNITLNWTAVLP